LPTSPAKLYPEWALHPTKISISLFIRNDTDIAAYGVGNHGTLKKYDGVTGLYWNNDSFSPDNAPTYFPEDSRVPVLLCNNLAGTAIVYNILNRAMHFIYGRNCGFINLKMNDFRHVLIVQFTSETEFVYQRGIIVIDYYNLIKLGAFTHQFFDFIQLHAGRLIQRTHHVRII
jgi:hypothetical protein